MIGMLPRTEEQKSQYKLEDEKGPYQWRNFMRAGGANDFRTARPKLYYPLVVDRNKKTIRIPNLE